MVATVDIKTGEKTVLDYLIKPFNKAKKALRERLTEIYLYLNLMNHLTPYFLPFPKPRSVHVKARIRTMIPISNTILFFTDFAFHLNCLNNLQQRSKSLFSPLSKPDDTVYNHKSRNENDKHRQNR